MLDGGGERIHAGKVRPVQFHRVDEQRTHAERRLSLPQSDKSAPLVAARRHRLHRKGIDLDADGVTCRNRDIPQARTVRTTELDAGNWRTYRLHPRVLDAVRDDLMRRD